MAASAADWIFSLSNYFNVTTAIVTLLLCLIIVNWLRQRPNNLPPGPTGLPIVGYYPFLAKTPHLQFAKLAGKYGDVMSLNLMGKTVIHLNGSGVMSDAFHVETEPKGRPEYYSYFEWLLDGNGCDIAPGYPAFMENGSCKLDESAGCTGNVFIQKKYRIDSERQVWKETDQFRLSTFGEFGFGKRSIEDHVTDITQDLLTILKQSKGEPQDASNLLSASLTNLMCSIVFDKRYKLDDAELLQMRDDLRNIVKNLSFSDVFLSGSLMKCFFRRNIHLQAAKESFFSKIDQLIREHEETFDESRIRDYVDIYLEKRKRVKEEGKRDEVAFPKDRLKSIIFNLFIAGTVPSVMNLQWALKLLMTHQTVQDKIQEELDEMVGKERLPSSQDLEKLPYTEAVIRETARLADIEPFITYAINPVERKILQYTIPKGSILLGNQWTLLNDPNDYPHPEKFDPSKFVDSHGNLKKNEGLLPTVIDKRPTLAQSLEMTEVFLLLSTILQRFSITLPAEDEDKSSDIDSSITPNLPSFRLCAHPR